MEKEPLEEAGPGPGKVEKRDGMHGDGWVFVLCWEFMQLHPQAHP